MARPRKPESEKYKTPTRQFGRVQDDPWNEIQEAVAASELESLVAWALPTLLKKARREKQQREKSK